MIRRKFPVLLTMASLLVALTCGSSPAWAGNDKEKKSKGQENLDRGKKAVAARKEAFKRAAALGLKPGVAGWKGTANLRATGKRSALVGVPPVAPIPPFAAAGGIPHYFGPFGNWAYSPLPTGFLKSITVTAGGTGYSATPTVTVDDVYIPLTTCTFPWTATGGIVDPILVLPAACGATNFSAPWVTITDATGTGATADAVIGAATPGGPLTGGLLKFQDPVGGVTLGVKEPAGLETYPGSDYYEIGLVEYTHLFHSTLPATRERGYVQIATANVPGANALTYLTGPNAGSPILHPATGLPMFSVNPPSYLGPVIVATSNKAVRFKFYNLLPVGPKAANGTRPGDLFLPVDETIMGSGLGPAVPGGAGDKFTQNRHAVHLHGNNTVWISDGTPHQWITPANESTPYPQGVSVYNVPDMFPATVDSPTDGTATLYYTNAMSARLMFYHDHAYGITRLNVYAGEAAGYVVTDAIDQDLVNGTNVTGVNPGNLTVLPPDTGGLGIPLVIQDRTFVDPATIGAQDPTWNWGTGARDPVTGKITEYKAGDLWYPHVYMSAQNPSDLSGFNPFGRWHYGPWFTPPTPTCTGPSTPAGCIEVGPIPNEYFGTGAWEPPLRPGVPNPSMPGEAFMDTPIVNGVAYPYVVLEPRPYRFRILNAANDRFWNLQLYVAADKRTPTTAGGIGALACDGVLVPPADAPANCTEVAMRPVLFGDPGQTADTPSGLPIEANAGPKMWQIGSEGGWLAAPFEVPLQPIGFVTDPTLFNVGNVDQRSLFLGPAERADVVVDFTAFAGKTLILYNDAPAAVPAGVPTYDYFTGSPNLMDAGGAPSVQPGYGPNTRTIMQIRVGTTVAPVPPPPPPALPTNYSQMTFANLQAVWAKTAAKKGVFEVTQEPILIPQAVYNSAYNLSLPTDAAHQYLMIGDTQFTFNPLAKDLAGNISLAPNPVTLQLQMKGMHDEMGGVYDTQFGRMSGMLGLTNPNTLAAFLIPYNYSSPPTDLVKLSDDVSGAPVGTLSDGTQIWRIFHNGVDTHPIHVHLFNAQLINRIGQDNLIVAPEPNEFGWKDTFKVNPLEVTFLAMRPVIPTQAQLPFEVLDSVRLIEPGLPEGASLPDPPPAGWFDPEGVGITEVLNHFVNFGWEYVWHCHILAHEEMDMMHSLVGVAAPKAPSGFAAVWDGKSNPTINLQWADNSQKEAGYRIERATNATFTSGLTTINVPTNTTTYADKSVSNNNQYWYRLTALGATVGDTFVYPGSVGFPTMSANTVPLLASTNPVVVGTPPATVPANPTLLTATLQAGPQVTVGWRDNANNETGFSVQRCTGAACTTFAQIAIAPPRNNTGNTSFVDATVIPGNTYRYQVFAVNVAGNSLLPAGPSADVVVPLVPPAPTGFTVIAVKANGNNYTATLTWAATANPTNFTVQRATNALFTTGLTTNTYAGAARTATQTITKNTTYYYRIRANNSISGSSAWTNALPFPIRTGP